ncbi:glycogen debranching N-terminal domain-containing protein [Ornithinimicrobium cerasi]|uniref:Glycogen debranching enzyme (Alpha-1,6-glucosidase) n=2 Tax=Ornithinimicrobium cerasi TaxID=2248773 RepID=A0A285VU67_9MICO|nr:glycogen debranching N-terminal domain-containing protein [Ornithinimicrobium cerasi]SOC57630.1 Glycogen debranching enzyme (alpha-1,6-glucosidase) [Ornithinimicrobium cerasi]
MEKQPWLHELEIAVDGPSTVLSGHDGQIGRPGTGWFVDDRRVLSALTLHLDDEPAVAVACDTTGPLSRFWAAARHLGDDVPDPTVEVHRVRTLRGATLTEEITVRSRATAPVVTTLRLRLGGDGADLSSVKVGGADDTPVLPLDRTGLSWSDERHRTAVTVDPQPEEQTTDGGGTLLVWPLEVAPGGSAAVTLRLTADRLSPSAFDADAGSGALDLSAVDVGGDAAWQRMVRTNLTDLRHLLLTDPLAPEDVFAAAGSPWYLTLFGRDSLWAARFLLPYTTRLAHGTLRALARRQATEDDPALAAERGKILHEVRRTAYTGGTLDLPPLYYGTVDATPLWLVLLHDAWRWGLEEAHVRALLPAAHDALGWMERMCDTSPDGFLRYVDTTGTGLSNQGWKDSGDSMRRADGTLAPAPIALLEAQAYAVEAALGTAELLDALGEDGADRWRAWADDLTTRVRSRFWVGEGQDAYLAMALDADGRQVDGVGSNMGHALGTGLLTEEETRLVVDRLMRPDMLREFGIATLSADNPAYNPAGYHTGSVWVHDTAIVLHGLVRTGYAEQAQLVVDALVRLSSAVHHRFPELIAGDPVGSRPVPYPASCRPQAWSAASAAVLAAARDGRQMPSTKARATSAGS